MCCERESVCVVRESKREQERTGENKREQERERNKASESEQSCVGEMFGK